MASTLFVANQDVANFGIKNWIVSRQDCTARNTEHDIYASGFQATD
jgi:hypothetical protein